jgi:tetratricopeptide (TPR) repeat protein
MSRHRSNSRRRIRGHARQAPASPRGGLPKEGSRPRTRRLLAAATAALLLSGLWVGLRIAARSAGAPALSEAASPRELPRLEDTAELDPSVRRAVEEALARAEREHSAAAVGDLGRLYEAHHFHEHARRCYETARALEPAEGEWTYHLARLAAERGDAAAAISLYRSVLARRPDYLPAIVRLGGLLLDADRTDEARAAFEAISSDSPEASWRDLGLARVELRRAAPVRAVEHLERAHRLAPEHAETRYLLATALRDLGQVARDAELLRGLEQGALPEPPPDPWLQRVLEKRQDLQSILAAANSLAASGRTAEAEALYRSVLGYEPRHYDASYDLGLLYGRSGRYEEARAALEVAVSARPKSAEARIALGMAHAALGHLEAARREADRAAQLAPADDRPQRLLAELRRREQGP